MIFICDIADLKIFTCPLVIYTPKNTMTNKKYHNFLVEWAIYKQKSSYLLGQHL